MNHVSQEIITECSFRTSRSGGSGGQHVNKVETKVTLFFTISESKYLKDDQKKSISISLANRINNDGQLVISYDRNRSQIKNKEAVIKQFLSLLNKALKPVKKRKKTRPPKAAVEAIKKAKKHRSQIKVARKKPRLD